MPNFKKLLFGDLFERGCLELCSEGVSLTCIACFENGHGVDVMYELPIALGFSSCKIGDPQTRFPH